MPPQAHWASLELGYSDWHNDLTDGLVAAQNSSEEFITLHSSFDIAGVNHPLPPVPLAPGQGFLLALRKELETLGLSEVRLGGIEFTYEGPGDAVQAHGVLFNKQGFSAEIDFHRFTQWEERRDFTRRTPRFAIGSADPALGLPAPTVFEPVLLLHNFNRHPLDVTLAVGYRAPDGPQETQIPLQLSAGESQIIELAAHLSGIVPPEAHWASLELAYSDWHNGLAAALVSVSEDGEHSLNSVLNWVVGTNHEGWYWQVDGDRNTLLAIFNRRPEAVTVAVSLDFSAQGVSQSYDLPERTIPGRSTEMVDIGEVIAAGAPDEDGDVIPLDVTYGGYRVRKLGPDEEGALTTEALVLDRRRKTYTTYYNTGCCFISPPRMFVTSLSGTVGGSALQTLQLKNACTGAWESALNPFYWSDNTGIATIGSSSGDANLVAPGTTLLWGRGRYFEDRPWECLFVLAAAAALATVNNPPPTVSFGALTAVGKNLTGNVQVTISPSGTPITLTLSTTSGTGAARFSSNNSTSLAVSNSGTVSITGVAQSSTMNNIRLSAVSNGNTLATRDFTVIAITFTLRNTGTTSTDNSGTSTYSTIVGSSSLGTFFSTGSGSHIWRTGVEIVGTVAPSNFTGLITLQRDVIESRTFNDQTLTSVSGPFLDTSEPLLRDDNPQSGGSMGKVYDLDAPGLGNAPSNPVGTILRRRTNFRQWATINAVRVSADFFWFSRLSIVKTSSGDALQTSVSGDNKSGLGTTPLSWNLQ